MIDSAAGDRHHDPNHSSENGAAQTVLLVEDDAAVRRGLRRQLEIRGYRVLEADAGTAAIVLASGCQERIDIMVTDVVMPWLSGPEAADVIRVRRPGMRILYMSGYYPEPATVERINRRGDHYLQKPFTGAEMESAMLWPDQNATDKLAI